MKTKVHIIGNGKLFGRQDKFNTYTDFQKSLGRNK